MTTDTSDKPVSSARVVDPAAELIRASLAWRDRTPSIGEAHANLMRAADLFRAVEASPGAPGGRGEGRP